ncbi:tyrosine-type recombinase/integrase [Bythopirellula goksoeyrii]|uniref:Site-specific tyrosine recombinase XerC n=1 Tax=Bythopirellula goksoeyrii TaxID=1400387 RepID=A0A5B9Q869_9BACT|nr:site-specific integrase [Bythopirellula goksoeyrii]QEG35254.1 site-specific tyrosine recombinase XerC [Bythopirellula goksoeyrii]
MANADSIRVPVYGKHKPTGQARVQIDGRTIYLGKHGSAASKEAYQRITAEWLQAGGKLARHRNEVTVVEIIAAYMRFARTYYRKNRQPTNEVYSVKRALGVVKELYGREQASKFGPLALKTVRQAMIEKDWCRSQVNKQVDRVKRVFKWAVSEEMIPGSVFEALRTVTGLRKGRSQAKESSPVKPVANDVVEATIEKLPEIVSDMVQVQRLTGARPGEICDMRPGDINRKPDTWEYIPQSHKTEHHDQPRVIFIGPKCQQILLKYLLRPADCYCFSPAESEAKRRAAQHEQRQTPLSCGNKPGSNCKVKPLRTSGDKYDTRSYGRAIRRAAKAAGVPTWSPHRLRHSFATEVRKSHGLEAVQVCLGHSKADVTQVYTARNMALAAAVAAEIG